MPDDTLVNDIEIQRDEYKRLAAEIRSFQTEQKKKAEQAKKEAETKLETILTKAADKVAKETALKHGVNDEDIKPFLYDEVERLKFFYEKQFNQGIKHFMGKWAMFNRNMAMGAMTMGDIWHLFWQNLWNLLFGPWVIGAGFVILQWLLISNYVPPSGAKSFLLIMAPIIGGLGVFMLNFMGSKNPMDWLTHIISGFIIAYMFGMLIVAIFNGIDNFPGGVMWFWITWFLSSMFIGSFQLYQLGGFRAVFQIAVLILLFSYVALGPYQATYRQFIDRIKEPFTLAFRAIANAFNDAWVLATNPTEWYARQQLRNVRSERPLETPKGVEIVRLESLTPNFGIPHDEEFEVFAIIQNQGKMDARDVSARIECNEFCKLPDNINDITKNQDKDKLNQGEQLRLRFSGLTANKPGKDAFQIAKVTLFINYTYETNSSLPVTIASEAEINRSMSAKEDVFKPVTSIAMEGLAQLSLNVGPQPLKSNDAASLLVAITNSRTDGTIVLKRGMKLFIDVPDGVGSVADKACRTGTRQVQCSTGAEETERCQKSTNCIAEGCKLEDKSCKPLHQATCTINPSAGVGELQIKATDFSTILPIYCSMTTNTTDVFKSDRIKAGLPSYIFVTKKSLEVTVTQGLGIANTPTPTSGT